MANYTYPGVYIEEIPSGVRTITGVPTSITAFIGRALRGQTEEPILINSFADYERQFGGLWADSMMSYAVRNFYQNGGSQAVIVRLYEPQFSDQTAAWTAAEAAALAAAAAVEAAAQAAADHSTILQGVADAASDEADAQTGDAATAAANAVAAAAQAAVASATFPSDVVDAATAAKAAAVQAEKDSAETDAGAAADAVADAAQAAAADPSATPDSVATAASATADAQSGDAAIAAATAVAQAAQAAAADPSATPDSVATAASDAVPAAVQAAKDSAEAAAQAAADAVEVAAQAAADHSTILQGIADAASIAAAAQSGDAAIAAANAVAQAVQDAVDTADPSTTPDVVAGAATAAKDAAVEYAANLVAPSASAQLLVDNLTLEAASPGSWGGKLKATVDHDTKDPSDVKLFNLTVFEDVNGGSTEKFLNVSIDEDDPRYLPRVLEQGSMFVRVSGSMPGTRPGETSADVSATGGSDGNNLTNNNYLGNETAKTGIYAFKKADLFNLLCIPPATRGTDTDPTVYQNAMKLCADRRAMLIVDSPVSWGAAGATAANTAKDGLDGLGLSGINARNAALYFPHVRQPDPERDGQVDTFVPCGVVAGLIASTDARRGVWKAPAGLDAALQGIHELQVKLTDMENGVLNPLGINCLRTFPVNGRVVWGARTLRGADQLADEYRYVPVRRLALYIEESLYRGTQWVVFEPNDEPLWAQIRLNLGAFMHNLFRQGAFQGSTPRDAYFVKCDRETTTQNDIDQGIVNIVVGFAPLKPAEFVVIKLQQIAGQIQA